jgi:transcriptional regulator with XRE-family HTH domain
MIREGKISFELGILIRKYRQACGISQESLAEKARLHPTFISLVETKKRAIGLDTANQVARALNLKLSDLIKQAEQKLP